MNRKHRLYSDKEKQELLDCIEASIGPIREALARLGISKSTYYD
jgi:transcriptional regulator of acetoin/glycerol metabolism